MTKVVRYSFLAMHSPNATPAFIQTGLSFASQIAQTCCSVTSRRRLPLCSESRSPPPSTYPSASASPREQLLRLVSAPDRTGNVTAITTLVSSLESLPQSPLALDPLLLGVWRNAHTTLPGTASIIQRSVVSNINLAPNVEQVVLGNPQEAPSRIVNRVDFRALLGGALNVQAVVERVEGPRLFIRFDRAWFAIWRRPFWLGGAKLDTIIRFPYPVPFRLLGSKAKGWLDVTYLDDHLRIARGNRGSAFVLTRKKVELHPADAESYLETWID